MNTAPPRPLTFFVISDPHVTYPVSHPVRMSEDSVSILKETIADIEAAEADMVFVTGDILEGRYEGCRNLDLAFDTLSRLTVPWFVLIGNHDARHRSTEDAYQTADFIKRFKGFGPDGARAFWRHDMADRALTFIGLDTTQEFATEGALDDRQLEWLDSTLGNIGQTRDVIVFTHHPFVPFDPDVLTLDGMHIYLIDNHEDVKRTVERHGNVRLVISGHNHVRRALSDNGVTYLACPSINTWPAMYSRFTVTGDAVAYAHLDIRARDKSDRNRQRMLDPDSPWVKIFGSVGAVDDYFTRGPMTGRIRLPEKETADAG